MCLSWTSPARVIGREEGEGGGEGGGGEGGGGEGGAEGAGSDVRR